MNYRWNNENKMQFAFYAGVIVLFVFAFVYFGTSSVDRGRGEDAGSRISDSQNINTELQKSVENSQREIRGTIDRLGSAEAELDRAESSIRKCQQILGTAESRAQKTNSSVK